MKILLFVWILLFSTLLFAKSENYSVQNIPKNMSVKEKKERFYALLVPAVKDVYDERMKLYLHIKEDLTEHRNGEKIKALKKKYRVKTDRALLMALKPHPMSITLAQAAIESAWGTSRFFREANNIFGVHSVNPNEKSIDARVKIGSRTVKVRKYKDLDAAIRDYYFMIATVSKYQAFREMNYENRPVLEMVSGLEEYSERGQAYVKELRNIIRYNKLTKYDAKVIK